MADGLNRESIDLIFNSDQFTRRGALNYGKISGCNRSGVTSIGNLKFDWSQKLNATEGIEVWNFRNRKEKVRRYVLA